MVFENFRLGIKLRDRGCQKLPHKDSSSIIKRGKSHEREGEGEGEREGGGGGKGRGGARERGE